MIDNLADRNFNNKLNETSDVAHVLFFMAIYAQKATCGNIKIVEYLKIKHGSKYLVHILNLLIIIGFVEFLILLPIISNRIE
ncbi:hypothetical protein BFX31_12800 [Vibrio paracholerae]|nr:hypothetical protein BFX31_12800 [Vibrio paracholerae]